MELGSFNLPLRQNLAATGDRRPASASKRCLRGQWSKFCPAATVCNYNNPFGKPGLAEGLFPKSFGFVSHIHLVKSPKRNLESDWMNLLHLKRTDQIFCSQFNHEAGARGFLLVQRVAPNFLWCFTKLFCQNQVGVKLKTPLTQRKAFPAIFCSCFIVKASMLISAAAASLACNFYPLLSAAFQRHLAAVTFWFPHN